MLLRKQAIWPHLDEKGRRLWAASEAKACGRGGLKLVHAVTVLSRSVIGNGIKELDGESPIAVDGRIRRAGAGRKPLKETDRTLLDASKQLVEVGTEGRWLAMGLTESEKGFRKLAGYGDLPELAEALTKPTTGQ